MDHGPDRRQYGNTDIGGNATAHLGDSQTTHNLNISPGNTIYYLSIQGTSHALPHSKKRFRDEADGEQDPWLIKRRRCHDIPSYNERDLSQEGGLRDQAVFLVNKTLQAFGLRVYLSSSSTDHHHDHTNEHDARALHHLHSALCRSTGTRDTLWALVDRLYQNAFFPAPTRIFPSAWLNVRQEVYQEASLPSINTGLVHSTSLHASAQDLVCVLLAMLAMLSYNTGHSGNDNNSLVSKCTSGKLSLFAGLVTFAVARYLCIPSLVRQMSEWSGGALIIQDPFMHDLRIPKAHVEHFSLLQAFLRLRLGGTTAEAFIEAGQFNLTIGRRHGPVIRKADWSVKGRVRSDQRVVMAIILRTQDAKCTECLEQLVMSESGQFACHPCGKAFGNCASLKYLARILQASVVQSQTSASVPKRNQPSERSETVSRLEQAESDEEIDDNYDINGLQNIDFRVLHKRRQLAQESQTAVANNPDSYNSEAVLTASLRVQHELDIPYTVQPTQLSGGSGAHDPDIPNINIDTTDMAGAPRNTYLNPLVADGKDMKPTRQRPTRIPRDVWHHHRDLINDLYVNQKQTQLGVLKELRIKHLYISMKQLKDQLQCWKMYKYSRRPIQARQPASDQANSDLSTSTDTRREVPWI